MKLMESNIVKLNYIFSDMLSYFHLINKYQNIVTFCVEPVVTVKDHFRFPKQL